MDNAAILSRSSKIAALKRKQRDALPAEVTWDDEDRREYLTGFHKRKKERDEVRRKNAQARDRSALLERKKEVGIGISEVPAIS